MDISSFFHLFLHIDESLSSLTATYGFLTYLILFAVIFLETGFVITPFLPGDSLLFAAGAIASLGSLNIIFLVLILFISAVLGDALNYFIGRTWGRKIVSWAHMKNFLINYKHIKRTEEFYEKHGRKTIVFARFIPIIRTFAPFVAGIGYMDYRRFVAYNILGAGLWVLLFTLGGFFFGGIELVKNNFSIVMIVIIVLSLIPIFVEFIRNKK